MSAIRIALERARDLLATPNGYTKDAYARDAEGEPTPSRSVKAVSFCAIGALQRVTDNDDQSVIGALFPDTDMPNTALVRFNDDPSTTQADVLALFDRAIALYQ